jgi:hypothetical protein
MGPQSVKSRRNVDTKGYSVELYEGANKNDIGAAPVIGRMRGVSAPGLNSNVCTEGDSRKSILHSPRKNYDDTLHAPGADWPGPGNLAVLFTRSVPGSSPSEAFGWKEL